MVATVSEVPGLEVDVIEIAERAGIPLALGTAQPWLSGRGHLNELVQDQASPILVELLAEIHDALGGDATVLAAKRRGPPPTPDLIHVSSGQIIEVDEVQHFTSARGRSLAAYPVEHLLGFDIYEYRQLISRWHPKADRAFAHKVSADFSFPGGRQAQRAYNDALRSRVIRSCEFRSLIVTSPGWSTD
jgi:hypothetical protein